MRRILPKDYKYDKDSIITGIIFLGFPIVISVLINNLISKVEDNEYTQSLILLCMAIFGAFMLYKGIKNNLKVAKLRKWRKGMLKERVVVGTINDIEEVPVTKIKRKGSVSRYIDDITIYYSLVVNYIDPLTGYSRTIKSDPYEERLNYHLSSKEVKVYINENNEVLIDNLKLRKSMRDKVIEFHNKQGESQVEEYIDYMIDRYANIVSVVVVAAVILWIAFRILM